MGIQINGNTDIISATDGGLTVQGTELSGNNINVTGIITATSFSGNVTGNVTGNATGLSGTPNITVGTVTGNVNATGISTFSGGIQVGATTSIVVGSSFIKNNSVGLGETTTTGRNAGISTAEGTIIYNSSLREVQVYKGNVLGWRNIGDSFIEATGGTISDYNDPGPGAVYRAHVFSSSGSFDVTAAPPSSNTVEYLVVAGGGCGGCSQNGPGAGGGCAGGYITGSSFPVTLGPYSITVGGGGISNITSNASTRNGTPSYFGPPSTPTGITATGGGGGGSGYGPTYPNTDIHNGSPGGSGGGGGGDTGAQVVGGSGNTPPVSPPQGNSGGNGIDGSGPDSGGGGGGSSAIGGTATQPTGGVGGAGSSSVISGITTHYAAGGGGGSHSGGSGGAGGIGGGGTGGGSTPTAGSVSTCSGGGGGGNGPRIGSNGGSGIVVVRYQIGSLAATAKATGGLISYASGKTIHQFLSSGTFTVTNPGLSSVDYLVVGGGGGGGGAHAGGGGGAGGFRTG